jgi:hypothetical protein
MGVFVVADDVHLIDALMPMATCILSASFSRCWVRSLAVFLSWRLDIVVGGCICIWCLIDGVGLDGSTTQNCGKSHFQLPRVNPKVLMI